MLEARNGAGSPRAAPSRAARACPYASLDECRRNYPRPNSRRASRARGVASTVSTFPASRSWREPKSGGPEQSYGFSFLLDNKQIQCNLHCNLRSKLHFPPKAIYFWNLAFCNKHRKQQSTSRFEKPQKRNVGGQERGGSTSCRTLPSGARVLLR